SDPAIEPAPLASPDFDPVPDDVSTTGLERIATLLEQIEERRKLEARRPSK
ncbi:MAG: hypothetical protein H0U46_09650, partial [Actinobacteria bacterium]|nr:hypothetical protein [Actinomycetota bacterium]